MYCRTVVELRWQSIIRLIKCPHILRIVPLPKIYMRRSANVRPASRTVSQPWPCLTNFINRISKINNEKIKVEGRGSCVVGGRGGFRDIPFRSSSSLAQQLNNTISTSLVCMAIYPTNTRRCPNVGLMLVHCLYTFSMTTQQKQIICITFIQSRPNVFDVGPTLYKCYTNVLRLLG